MYIIDDIKFTIFQFLATCEVYKFRGISREYYMYCFNYMVRQHSKFMITRDQLAIEDGGVFIGMFKYFNPLTDIDLSVIETDFDFTRLHIKKLSFYFGETDGIFRTLTNYRNRTGHTFHVPEIQIYEREFEYIIMKYVSADIIKLSSDENADDRSNLSGLNVQYLSGTTFLVASCVKMQVPFVVMKNPRTFVYEISDGYNHNCEMIEKNVYFDNMGLYPISSCINRISSKFDRFTFHEFNNIVISSRYNHVYEIIISVDSKFIGKHIEKIIYVKYSDNDIKDIAHIVILEGGIIISDEAITHENVIKVLKIKNILWVMTRDHVCFKYTF